MPCLIDTSVAIPLRDGDPAIRARIAALAEPPLISVITRIELAGGVHAKPEFAAKRRAAVEVLLGALTVLDFDAMAAEAYRRVLDRAGYSRRKVFDRMIAATALAHRLALATLNPRDFQDIADLDLEDWSSATG